jgi:hypothetical protein
MLCKQLIGKFSALWNDLWQYQVIGTLGISGDYLCQA